MRRIALIIVALTVAACGTLGSQPQAPKNNTFRPYACAISTSPGSPCH